MKCTECSVRIRPVVAVDIDGTLGMYHEHFTAFAMDYIGAPVRQGYDGSTEFSEYLGMTKQSYREAKLAYRQGGMKRTMPPFSGARAFMLGLGQLGCEVWIATTRPWMRLDNIDPDTREWLRRNGIVYDYMLYGEDKYEQLHSQVGDGRVVAVVDDLREQLERAQEIFSGPALVRDWVPIQVSRRHNERDRYPNNAFGFDNITDRIKGRVEAWHAQESA